jgi:hypothetical protein
MNFFEAGRIKDQARRQGVCADRMGLPPAPGESLNTQNRLSECSVVFWVDGMDVEFTDPAEARRYLSQQKSVA